MTNENSIHDIAQKLSINFDLATIRNEVEAEQIRKEIRTFNDAQSIAHRILRQEGKKVLDIVIRDQAQSIQGGLLGYTYWGWVSIDSLWVLDELRGNGLGGHLMRLAETEALGRKCTHALVKAWSFQAKSFYERHSFQVTGELRDYPVGETLYWMQKAL